MRNRLAVEYWGARAAGACTLCLAMAAWGQQLSPQAGNASSPSSAAIVGSPSAAEAQVPSGPNAAPASDVPSKVATPAAALSTSQSPGAHTQANQPLTHDDTEPPASSGSIVGKLPTEIAPTPAGPIAAPVSEVTTTPASSSLSPGTSQSPAAPVVATVASPSSPPKVLCPDANWVLQEKRSHLPLTGDLYIKGLARSITADISTGMRVEVRVGDRLTKEVTFEPGRPTRLTFESQDGYWQESGVLLPVTLSVKSPADWPPDCRLLNFIVNVALNKVYFVVSGGPAALACEKPCDVVNPRKSRAIWGERIGFEVSLKLASDDAVLPGAVTIALEGDEVTSTPPVYTLPGYSSLKNLHFELVPKWRFFAVSPHPLNVRLDIGLGTDAATGRPLQGFITPLILESVPPWWARVPIWLVGALLWTAISMSPLVLRPGEPMRGWWRVAGALVSAALVFACIEAGASSLPKPVEDIPYSLWGSFLLGFATAMAGVTLVAKYVGKTVTGGVLDIKPEQSPPSTLQQETAVKPPENSAAGENVQPLSLSLPAEPAMPTNVLDLSPLENRSRLFICLHEAGHCLAAYEYGGHVESIDFPKTGDPHATVVRPPAVSKHIACGGFAVEYLLFKSGKIVDGTQRRISQKEFISAAMTNAERDKRSFFNGNFVESGGTWPAHMDTEFMTHAIAEVVPRLQLRQAAVIRIAHDLDCKGYLTKAEIDAVVLET